MEHGLAWDHLEYPAPVAGRGRAFFPSEVCRGGGVADVLDGF